MSQNKFGASVGRRWMDKKSSSLMGMGNMKLVYALTLILGVLGKSQVSEATVTINQPTLLQDGAYGPACSLNN